MTSIRRPPRPVAALAGIGGVAMVAIAIAAAFVAAAGVDPWHAFAVMTGHALGSVDGLLEVLVRAVPFTITGLGIVVAFRVNAFNIGADGQIIAGAIGAVWLATAFPDLAGWLLAPLFLIAGFVAGGLFGGFAGWLRARYNASEIITTIMLNYIAIQVLGHLVRGPLQETMRIMPQSERIPDGIVFDILIEGSRVHTGLIVAVVLTALFWGLKRSTTFGYSLHAVGSNPAAARYGGIDDRRVLTLAMSLSGAMAGLAGAVEIAGLHHRLQENFAPGFGITAIAVGLLARLNPLLVPAMAVLFGVLHVGSGAMQREAAVPLPIVWVIEGVVILAFLVYARVRPPSTSPAAG